MLVRPLGPPALHSLAVQARWLRQRLEWHLGGNHFFANAKALVFAGVFFQGQEAAGWLKLGLRLLEREIAEQILPDGGHFERSPMYHAIVLGDLLDVCNILGAGGLQHPRAWAACAARMGAWLATMTHPDGEIAFFNDAALGIAATPAALAEYTAHVLGGVPGAAAGTRLLPESGYARLESGRAVLLADCGAIGPDHLPAHAHADTLSFELSLGRERVLVNSGASVYAPGPERQRQRGTAAHNTLVVDGQDSSEVWHGFRVARRARPLDVVLDESDAGVALQAGHDGYRRLPGRNIHRRRWILGERCLTVEDTVSGAHRSAIAHFHLHADVVVERLDPGAGTAVTSTPGGVRMRWKFLRGAAAELHDSTWHPRFGCTVLSRCLQVAAVDGRLTSEIEWE
jgi:uncharacterized heparinase superfamily protein